jgi:hypothetical protein
MRPAAVGLPNTATSQVCRFAAQQPHRSHTVSTFRLDGGSHGKSINLVVTGLAASSLLLGGAMAGCSNNSSSTASSSSSASSSKQATATSATASAEPSDYSTLLIKATDIVVPNDTFTAMPATPNPAASLAFPAGSPTPQAIASSATRS